MLHSHTNLDQQTKHTIIQINLFTDTLPIIYKSVCMSVCECMIISVSQYVYLSLSIYTHDGRGLIGGV